jgi:HPt (histidine-containing phosphotransfer) domain-containing protein
MKRYISMYLNIAPNTFDSMKQNIIDKDWEQLRSNAHSLKPLTDYMGISDLKLILNEIEQNVDQKSN